MSTIAKTLASRYPIIGITGPKRSGKSTLAGAIISHGYTNFSFAGPLKLMMHALTTTVGPFPSDREADHPVLRCSERHFLQTLGTEWGRRQLDENIWIRILEERWKQAVRPSLVIDDVRFDNEAEWILAQGGIVLSLYRPGTYSYDNHRSEQGVNPALVTHHFENSGDDIEVFTRRVIITLCAVDFSAEPSPI